VKKFNKTIFIGLITVFSTNIYGQDFPTTDFYKEIKNYDLSVVLTCDSIFGDEDQMLQRMPILGFIGENFQRLHIKFISVIQNQSSPYEYFAYGKTKVKNNICEFLGTIKIKRAYTFQSEMDGYIQGKAICEVTLYEDKKQLHTGKFQGTLTCGFLIAPDGKFRYDAAALVADGFSNNTFIGTWTDYKTKKSKKCNFGDYRVPEFDCGDGQFIPCEEYVKNGWQGYVKCIRSSFEDFEKNCKEEFEEWWK